MHRPWRLGHPWDYCLAIAVVTIVSLCTSAVYRAGLLSILEGGLEDFRVAEYPALFTPVLVVRLDLAPEEFNQPTTLRVTVEHADGEPLSDVGFGFTYQRADSVDERLSAYQVIIQQLILQVRRDGLYRVNVTLAGQDAARLTFLVTRFLPQA